MIDKELYQKILDNTVLNKEYSLKYNYYEWNQWNLPWIETKSWLRTIDKVNNDKVYQWIVLNLIEDAIWTMVNLINWEEKEWAKAIETEKATTNEWMLNINFDKIEDNIILNNLIYWKSYTYLYLNKDNWQPEIEVFSPMSVYKNENNYYLVKTITEYNKTFYIIEEYLKDVITWKKYHNTYKNDGLIESKEINNIPFKEQIILNYLNDWIIKNQDIINVKQTKIYEVEKYNSDPLLIIKGGDVSADDTIETGSWWVILLWNSDSWVERLEWLNVDNNFIELLDKAKKDFYKVAKLWALKNEDVSWITSWYALQLRLSDTLAFVNKFRNLLKIEILKTFLNYYEDYWIELFNFKEIMFLPIIWENKKIEDNKLNKMNIIKEKASTILDLIKAWYSKKEAEEYINNNL